VYVYHVRALDSSVIKAKYDRLPRWLDERRRRLWAAVEAEQLGFGGVSAVAAAAGLSRNTIWAGLTELAEARRARRPHPGHGVFRLDLFASIPGSTSHIL
jgi:hypothetical protein